MLKLEYLRLNAKPGRNEKGPQISSYRSKTAQLKISRVKTYIFMGLSYWFYFREADPVCYFSTRSATTGR